MILVPVFVACAAAAASHVPPSATPSTFRVKSDDGTPIAVECSGAGPTLLIVHGGAGDRSRWKPLFPLFATHFTVCAMDRRGHGESGDSGDYSLRKEAQDVAAVANSLRGKVFVLGHSFGAVTSLEAAFLTKNIAKLVLYEPPIKERDHTAVADKMEKLLLENQREQATILFMQEIVMLSPNEITRMRERPSWQGLVASIDTSLRQIRALNSYRFEPQRVHTIQVPTLLLAGSQTPSPDLREAIHAMRRALPHSKLFVFKGQQHNAMDTVPQKFASVVTAFLLGR